MELEDIDKLTPEKIRKDIKKAKLHQNFISLSWISKAITFICLCFAWLFIITTTNNIYIRYLMLFALLPLIITIFFYLIKREKIEDDLDKKIEDELDDRLNTE